MLVHSGGIHLLYPTPLDLLSTRPQICLQQNREQGSLMAFFCSRFLNFWSGGFVSGTPKTFRPSNLGHTPYLISDSSTRLYCPVSMSLSFRYSLGLNAMLSLVVIWCPVSLACIVLHPMLTLALLASCRWRSGISFLWGRAVALKVPTPKRNIKPGNIQIRGN